MSREVRQRDAAEPPPFPAKKLDNSLKQGEQKLAIAPVVREGRAPPLPVPLPPGERERTRYGRRVNKTAENSIRTNRTADGSGNARPLQSLQGRGSVRKVQLPRQSYRLPSSPCFRRRETTEAPPLKAICRAAAYSGGKEQGCCPARDDRGAAQPAPPDRSPPRRSLLFPANPLRPAHRCRRQ